MAALHESGVFGIKANLGDSMVRSQICSTSSTEVEVNVSNSKICA